MKLQFLSLALILVACGKSSNKETDVIKLNSISSVSADQMMKLSAFENCAVADSYIRTNLRRKSNDVLEQMKLWYLDYGSHQATVMDSASKSEAGTTSDLGNAPADYTKTNTQVAGVDEPDMMKTDGKHIYMLSGSHVQVVKSWPADDLKKVAQIDVGGWPVGLFLSEDQKLIVASHPEVLAQTRQEFGYSPWYYDSFPDYNVTTLSVYDVAVASSPKLLRAYNFHGQYLGMRRQGNNIRLVMSNYESQLPAGMATDISIYDEDGKKMSPRSFLLALEQLRVMNEKVIQKTTFRSWMASQFQGYGSAWKGVSDDRLDKADVDCHSIYAGEALADLGLTTITSLNFASESIDQSALLAKASTIYASAESLYLSYNHSYWWWGWWEESAPKAFIHKFQYASADSSQLVYKASATIDGSLKDQFSMDEFEGNLRVAVTDEKNEAGIDPRSGFRNFNTVNRVVVLKEAEGKLQTIGQTNDLAPGERIYSTRFDGKKGYVVTFRQTDPLFTLDLSDPSSPKVLGELKVDGFSTYIHLMDENHLLTVGQDADPMTGRPLGLKITVFDVTDPTEPKEQYTKVIARQNGYTWSDASYDHHAFTYFASRGLLALPLSGYTNAAGNYWWDQYFSELRVFKIDLAKGILDQGAIPMNDLYRANRVSWDYWWGGATVQRSLFADDYVYALSSTGIKSVRSEAMSVPVSAAGFYP